MVLRSSPWESRTPPATKGHFARGGPLRESGGGLSALGGLCSIWNGGRADFSVPSAPSCDMGMTAASPSGLGGGA